MTATRLHVLHLFDAAAEPYFTPEGLYRRVTSDGLQVARSTIYRMFAQFAEVGLLTRNSPPQVNAYGSRTSASLDHIVCLDCGNVVGFNDEPMRARVRALLEANGYAQEAMHELTIHGRCATCRAVHSGDG